VSHYWLPCCSDIEEHLDEGGNMSPFVTNFVELAPLILYNIVNTSACMVEVWQLARDFG
jgi:hypothetical protein